MHTLSISGGAFLGEYGRVVGTHIWKNYRVGCVTGTSVGALDGIMIAMDKTDELAAIWGRVNQWGHPMLGVPGFMSPAWLARPLMGEKRDGFFSLKPLRKQIEKHVDPADLRVPMVINYVNRTTGEHVIETIDVDTAKGYAWDLVQASCAQSGVMHSVDIGGDECVDGGNEDVICPVPDRFMEYAEVVHSVYHQFKPWDEHAGDHDDEIDGPLAGISWGIAKLMRNTVVSGFEELKRRTAHYGAEHWIWHPAMPLGDSLRARRSDIEKRGRIAEATIARGPIRLMNKR